MPKVRITLKFPEFKFEVSICISPHFISLRLKLQFVITNKLKLQFVWFSGAYFHSKIEWAHLAFSVSLQVIPHSDMGEKVLPGWRIWASYGYFLTFHMSIKNRIATFVATSQRSYPPPPPGHIQTCPTWTSPCSMYRDLLHPDRLKRMRLTFDWKAFLTLQELQ